MDEDQGICGRNKEINGIYNFISSKIESKSSGTLYVTGLPGTGKTMSVDYVLTKIKNNVPKMYLNCLKAQTSKVILNKICHHLGLDNPVNLGETEIYKRISKKIGARTSTAYIIVLDEIDQIPKSRNLNLFRTIFSWQNQMHSKLILIGISNMSDLTTICSTMGQTLKKDKNRLAKIVFKPYSSKDIKAILQWYLENDENFEDALIETKALDLIAMKFANDKRGDIRGAVDALRNSIEDALKKVNNSCTDSQNILPTPPSTPPASPCKEKTNIASVANSIKKRQKSTQYMDDSFPFTHQIILVCLSKLITENKNHTVDFKACHDFVFKAFKKFGFDLVKDDFTSMIDSLETQGLIRVKRVRPLTRIIITSTESVLDSLVKRKEMIEESINNLL